MKQEFVQEGMRTYLKIEGDDLENVGDKMFSYQTIPGFVPMEIEWVDEKKQYVYDVTGKLNLKQYLEKDGIGKHKVKKVMECLLSLPERLESYLLDGYCRIVFLWINIRKKCMAYIIRGMIVME